MDQVRQAKESWQNAQMAVPPQPGTTTDGGYALARTVTNSVSNRYSGEQAFSLQNRQ